MIEMAYPTTQVREPRSQVTERRRLEGDGVRRRFEESVCVRWLLMGSIDGLKWKSLTRYGVGSCWSCGPADLQLAVTIRVSELA